MSNGRVVRLRSQALLINVTVTKKKVCQNGILPLLVLFFLLQRKLKHKTCNIFPFQIGNNYVTLKPIVILNHYTDMYFH